MEPWINNTPLSAACILPILILIVCLRHHKQEETETHKPQQQDLNGKTGPACET